MKKLIAQETRENDWQVKCQKSQGKMSSTIEAIGEQLSSAIHSRISPLFFFEKNDQEKKYDSIKSSAF